MISRPWGDGQAVGVAVQLSEHLMLMIPSSSTADPDPSDLLPSRLVDCDCEQAFRGQSLVRVVLTLLVFWGFNDERISGVGQAVIEQTLSPTTRRHPYRRLFVYLAVRLTVFHQFCGGVSLRKARRRIAQLAKRNVKVAVDYAVESGLGEAAADAAKDEILKAVHFASARPEVSFVPVKVTAICDANALQSTSSQLPGATAVQREAGLRRLNEICGTAARLGQTVLIDAEQSWIQDAIDDWATLMMSRYNSKQPIVFTTVQMYRRGRLDYLQSLLVDGRLHERVIGVKIVRGAYLEAERTKAAELGVECPLQSDLAATHQAFDSAVRFCVDRLDRFSVFVGTHNLQSLSMLARLMDDRGYRRDHPRIHFGQLAGMSNAASYKLADAGFNVVKYLPYGPVSQALPYLFRRAKENSSVAGEASRELQLVEQELRRRIGVLMSRFAT
jgi:proline dehydrogenase